MAKGTKTLNSAIQVDNDGNVFFVVNGTAPSDGEVGNGEAVFYIDPAGPTLKVKTRNGASVLSGDVASLS